MKELSEEDKEKYGFQTGNPKQTPLIVPGISSFLDTHDASGVAAGELQRAAMNPVLNHPVSQHVFGQSLKDAIVSNWLKDEKRLGWEDQ